MPTEKLRLALLISGGGTTMREIIRACNDGRLPRIEPRCVIASRHDAGGIVKALEEGVDTACISVIDPIKAGTNFASLMLRILNIHSIDLIGQYGWMPQTPVEVIEKYSGWMINQHPGPLDPGRPDFGGRGMFGRRVHCARIYFLRRATRPMTDMYTEAVAQRVAVDYDKGAVIRRRVVRIEPSDDPISLQQAVLPEEHQVQIEALTDFSENRVTELSRDEPLVHHNEFAILKEAKKVAKVLFPQG